MSTPAVGTATTEAPRPERRPVSGLLVWWVVGTGPAVWMAHLSGSAALVPLQCRLGTTWMVNAFTTICGLVIAASIVTGHWLRKRALASGEDTRSVRSVAFIALVGQAWGFISLAVTILEGLPNTVLHSCPK
ncbi:MAG: hypothetical protein ABI276_00525 [Acidimicrobiales bacterium]